MWKCCIRLRRCRHNIITFVTGNVLEWWCFVPNRYCHFTNSCWKSLFHIVFDNKRVGSCDSKCSYPNSSRQMYIHVRFIFTLPSFHRRWYHSYHLQQCHTVVYPRNPGDVVCCDVVDVDCDNVLVGMDESEHGEQRCLHSASISRFGWVYHVHADRCWGQRIHRSKCHRGDLHEERHHRIPERSHHNVRSTSHHHHVGLHQQTTHGKYFGGRYHCASCRDQFCGDLDVDTNFPSINYTNVHHHGQQSQQHRQRHHHILHQSVLNGLHGPCIHFCHRQPEEYLDDQSFVGRRRQWWVSTDHHHHTQCVAHGEHSGCDVDVH
eukprot:PhF_6_TR26390/c0_g2_i5/m.38091